MRLLLVGPPGSGKGTQAKLLSQRENLSHLATGDLLREAIHMQTPAGLLAQPYLGNGQLVPDEVVNQMVAEKFRRSNRPGRFVMDGYPRTRSQAEVFDRLLQELSLSLEGVIELAVDDETLVERLDDRRVCSNPNCQTSYHLISNPPRLENICDVCNSPLIQRVDDNEATIRHRLKVYHQTSSELLDHYRRQGKLHRVNANNDIELVYRAIDETLKAGKIV